MTNVGPDPANLWVQTENIVLTRVLVYSVLANTVNISAIPPFDIQILLPLRWNVLPSSERTARVWIEAASLPLWLKYIESDDEVIFIIGIELIVCSCSHKHQITGSQITVTLPMFELVLYHLHWDYLKNIETDNNVVFLLECIKRGTLISCTFLLARAKNHCHCYAF